MKGDIQVFCYRIFLIICFNGLIKRDFKLVDYILIPMAFQNVQPIADFSGVIVDQCTEEAIPDRKYVAEIRVCPGPFKMVVKLMHIGRDEHQAQGLIQPYRH